SPNALRKNKKCQRGRSGPFAVPAWQAFSVVGRALPRRPDFPTQANRIERQNSFPNRRRSSAALPTPNRYPDLADPSHRLKAGLQTRERSIGGAVCIILGCQTAAREIGVAD